MRDAELIGALALLGTDRQRQSHHERVAYLRGAVGAAQIDRALSDAAAYIALDGEDGQSTYRLAHQTFAEHFRRDGR